MLEIAESPENFAKKKGNHRAAVIDTFPYVIVFEIIITKKIVFVSYIFHTRRNSHLKYKR